MAGLDPKLLALLVRSLEEYRKKYGKVTTKAAGLMGPPRPPTQLPHPLRELLLTKKSARALQTSKARYPRKASFWPEGSDVGSARMETILELDDIRGPGGLNRQRLSPPAMYTPDRKELDRIQAKVMQGTDADYMAEIRAAELEKLPTGIEAGDLPPRERLKGATTGSRANIDPIVDLGGAPETDLLVRYDDLKEAVKNAKTKGMPELAAILTAELGDVSDELRLLEKGRTRSGSLYQELAGRRGGEAGTTAVARERADLAVQAAEAARAKLPATPSPSALARVERLEAKAVRLDEEAWDLEAFQSELKYHGKTQGEWATVPQPPKTPDTRRPHIEESVNIDTVMDEIDFEAMTPEAVDQVSLREAIDRAMGEAGRRSEAGGIVLGQYGRARRVSKNVPRGNPIQTLVPRSPGGANRSLLVPPPDDVELATARGRFLESEVPAQVGPQTAPRPMSFKEKQRYLARRKREEAEGLLTHVRDTPRGMTSAEIQKLVASLKPGPIQTRRATPLRQLGGGL